MVPAAANAFLKLLEEPPAGWVIILLAANVNKLLPTIMSRVVQLHFQALEPQLVEQALQASADYLATVRAHQDVRERVHELTDREQAVMRLVILGK